MRRNGVDRRIQLEIARFRPGIRGRIAVILAAALGLPWLPAPEAPPEGLPMLRARGQSSAMIWRFAFSPDGRTIASTDGLEGVTIRRGDRGWCVDRSLEVRGLIVAFAPDGRRLAVGGLDSDVVSCDLGPAGERHPLGIPVREVSDLAFSPDGRTLAVSSYRTPEIILWDIESGRQRMLLRGHTTPVLAMAFAPDGSSLASSANKDPAILLWDLATGRPRQRIAAPGAISLAFSPDGRRLATTDGLERSARLWDTRTGIQFTSIGYHRFPMRSAVFSPDGRILATAGGDGNASVWSLASGRELRRLDGQADLLRRIAFSPDGRTLMATANDSDIRLWDLDGLASEMGEL